MQKQKKFKYTYNYPGFRKAWLKIPLGISMRVRSELMQALKLNSESSFLHKKNGIRPLTDYEREMVDYIFGLYGIDYLSGKITDANKYLKAINRKIPIDAA